ncbi:hypothetical protein BBI11_12770 [Planococcus maritimus]|nr:hypothetical protein BBI11_12770 [Planococcus maritimus]
MPRTLLGKISLVMLLIFVILSLLIVVMLYINGLWSIIILLYMSPFVAPLGLIFGIAGVVSEKKGTKIVPLFTILFSGLYIIIFLITYYGYTFGG